MGFWDVHGIFGGLFLLFFLAFLPRFTLACAALLFGVIGVTFWGFLGWIFMPRLLIAIIATTIYWNTNPVLCVLLWLIALGGETSEKKVAAKQLRR